MSSRPLSSLLLLLLVSLLSTALGAHAQMLRALSTSEGSAAGHAGEAAGSTAAKSESHEAKVESPSTVSFTGPLVAGALAIVLIGAVVKFRTRAGPQ